MSRFSTTCPDSVAALGPDEFGFGIGYDDGCTSLKGLRYTNTVSDPIAATPAYHDQTILVQLTLRTLGEVETSFDTTSLLDSPSPAVAGARFLRARNRIAKVAAPRFAL